MDRVAFISGSGFIYWSSLVLTAAAVIAVCFFLWAYLKKGGSLLAAFVMIPLALGASLILGRFVHWYCRTDSYDSFLEAMTDYSSGGYALLGVFAGCLLAAALTRLLCLHRDLPAMLDAMSIAACAGLTVGRLSFFFNSADRGQILASIRSLPLAYPVVNAVSGALEYRLATFVLQAAVALALLVGLCLVHGKPRTRPGDVCLLFMLWYGASQVVLDSTRYDSLFFRSNGFVSMVQVFGAVMMAMAMVLLSVRLCKRQGFRFWYVLLWIVQLAAIVGAGFMEYYVQRMGSAALLAYTIMSVCLITAVMISVAMRAMAAKHKKRA